MFTIIAPAYNNPDEVRKMLESIKAADKPCDFEVLVADDGSKDLRIKDVVSPYPFARYIRLEKNSGAAAARNLAAREARYENLFFVDSDVLIFKDTLIKVMKCFERKEIKAFVGRLDKEPENKGFFPRYKALMFNSWLPKDDFSTVFSPAVGGIKKDVFFASGGYDERIKGATVEYLKFSYELIKICKIYFCPEVVVRVKLNSFKKALCTDFYSTMKWVVIFSKYKKIDNHCTSVGNAAGRLAGMATLFTFFPALLLHLLLLWLLLLVGYILANRHFFFLLIKEESFLFFLAALPVHMILSTMTVFGGIAGTLLVMANRIRKVEF